MSTGADAKTMPVTAAYEDGHERIFGPSPTVAVRTARARYVMRCSGCDGIELPPGARLYDCSRCGGKDCVASVDASIAPALAEEARSAPVMVDRFMEGAVSTEGVDIGSRQKRKDYMRATGATDKSDYRKDFGDRVRASGEREMQKLTRETVAQIAWTDPRWKP